ncbi:MAG: bile acid:sodium symporter [Candidatus Margulisiibacteriota bacterium]
MKPIIQLLVSLFMFTFILTSLFGAGLGLTIREIAEPLKKMKFVFLALIANFILIPAAAYLLSVLLKADPSMQAGLVILACCGGAPFLPKLVGLGKGNIASSIGLMVLLMVSTVIFSPILLPYAIPGLSIDPWAIARPQILLMLLPLAIGLALNAWRPSLAGRLKKIFDRISSMSLIAWLILAIFIDYHLVVSAYGTGVYNLTLLFTLATIVIAYLLGGSSRAERQVMVLGSGTRNIAAALLIAAANFSDPRVVTVVMIGSLVQFVILFPLAYIQGRRS